MIWCCSYAASPEQICVENYYKELQNFANNPGDLACRERLKDMFLNKKGSVYNDVAYFIKGDSLVPGYITGLLSTIGELWNTKEIKLHYFVNPNMFEYKYTNKPGYHTAKDQRVAFVSVSKKVTGTGQISFNSYDVFQIEDGKIVSISNRDGSSVKFMSALDYYERKDYNKAYDMFSYEAENNNNDLSQYWLSIMLLKKQGSKCKYMNKNVRESLALFWLSKLGYKQDASRILDILQVGNKPYTNCQKPFNDGLLSCINKKGMYGFVNQYGTTVIGFRYTYAHAFVKGLAVVSLGYRKFGVIDTKGRTVIPFEYEEISDINNRDIIYAKKGDQVYAFDGKGNLVKEIVPLKKI